MESKPQAAIGGRPRSLTPANVALARRMKDQEGISANAVAAQFGVSKSTLLRALRREDLAAEASIINADEIDRRDNEGSDPFDFFFPTEAWDAAFNGKVYNACEAAGHKWGDN